MSTERWSQVQRLFKQALDQPRHALSTWLQQACGADEVLRSQVEALLRADGRTQDFLERPPLTDSPMSRSRVDEVTYPRTETEVGTSRPSGEPQREGERFLAGTVLADRYRVIYLLGRGGMGEVYRADDLRLGSPVALKLLTSAEQGKERLESFYAELRLARQVTHPHVCRLYDLVETPEGIFLSMEYVDGDDLASLLRRLGRLPRAKALQLARQLASGLAAIHEQGILHRDLKPANLMIDGAGKVKIMDFGIAAFSADTSRGHRGTPAYMAPEQHAGASASVRTDLYALGLVIYKLFTGKRATDGRLYPRPTVPPSQLLPDLDAEIDRLIMRCLAFDPSQRPESVLEVGKALASRTEGKVSAGEWASWRPRAGETLPGRLHWQLERQLSQGGFGDVWLATHVKTREARVFKLCYDHPRLQALQREVTIYRLLKENLGERDDISRILDWSFDQPPYFVEAAYTDGGALSDWAEAQGGLDRIPLEVRLEIIAQVATALAAAHSVGVLHQDIKPDNVLIAIDGEGRAQARLSDFGVGEVLARERLVSAGITVLGFTESAAAEGPSSLQGTRLYMAPELLEGKPATVRADLYALGVMLYQIATGDFSRAVGPGWERDIEDEVLREDIGQLVDRAPEQRAGDAQRVAERLRHLDERRLARQRRRREAEEATRLKADLIIARRRRRLALAAVLILAIFTAMMGVQSQRIRREAETAEQISSFLVDLFEISNPDAEWTGDLKARQILDWGARRIERELQDQPQVQARLMLTMGRVYEKLGLHEAAIPLVEGALEARRKLYGEDSVEAAEALAALAAVMIDKGDYQEAEKLSSASLELRKHHLGEQHADVAESLEILARAQAALGRSEAEALFREALKIRRAVHDEESIEIATILGRLARFLIDQANFSEAETLLEEALRIQRSELGSFHPSVALSLNELAFLRQYRGAYAGAEELLQEALEIRRQILGEEHHYVGLSLGYLAYHYEMRGDFERSENLYQEQLELFRRILGDHRNSAVTLDNLARLYQSLDRYEEAEQLLQESLEMRRRLYGENHPEIGRSLNLIAFLKLTMGRLEEAEELHRRALKMHRELGFDSQYTASSLVHKALVLQVLGQPAVAEQHFREGIAIYHKTLGKNHYISAQAMGSLADLLIEEGRIEEAQTLLIEALELTRKNSPPGHWRVHILKNALGACHLEQGRFQEAETVLLDSYAGIKQQKGQGSLYSRTALLRLIKLYESWGNEAEARKYRLSLQEITDLE